MPIYLSGSAEEQGLLASEAARFKSLVNDMERVLAGTAPTWAELVAAPMLQDWRLQRRGALCLVGDVVDHPRLGPGPIVTSDLVLFSPERGWARTLSRFYRLAEPDGTEDGRQRR